MKVSELADYTPDELRGRRVRVTSVEDSVVCQSDARRLMNQAGTAKRFSGRGLYAQLVVDWDDKDLGLMLSSGDEIELLSAPSDNDKSCPCGLPWDRCAGMDCLAG